MFVCLFVVDRTWRVSYPYQTVSDLKMSLKKTFTSISYQFHWYSSSLILDCRCRLSALSLSCNKHALFLNAVYQVK